MRAFLDSGIVGASERGGRRRDRRRRPPTRTDTPAAAACCAEHRCGAPAWTRQPPRRARRPGRRALAPCAGARRPRAKRPESAAQPHALDGRADLLEEHLDLVHHALDALLLSRCACGRRANGMGRRAARAPRPQRRTSYGGSVSAPCISDTSSFAARPKTAMAAACAGARAARAMLCAAFKFGAARPRGRSSRVTAGSAASARSEFPPLRLHGPCWVTRPVRWRRSCEG
jgi:hypothetical protein